MALVGSLSCFMAFPVLADLNDGLVAYYPFNGNANDASNNENNGIVYGATLTKNRFGNANSAYSFNYVHERIEVQDSQILNFGFAEFSISAWINTSQTGIWKRIVTKRANTNSGN